jgi:signal transduction histidine kinase
VTTVGELTASIAHEVNQPLAAIVIGGQACARWLASEPPNLDEARKTLDRIIDAGTRASDVLARIRALVKKTGTEKEPVDMNEVVHDVVAITRGELRKNEVACRTEMDRELPCVIADRVQLQQVLLNLIMNAIEAMSAIGGQSSRELIITTRRDASQQVRVAVCDSGVGIDPQGLEQVFEAFYTTKESGMGIGLSISRSIVETHGGRLWAERNDGPGATFVFTLPIADPS